MSKFHSYAVPQQQEVGEPSEEQTATVQREVALIDLERVIALRSPSPGHDTFLVQTTGPRGIQLPYNEAAFNALRSALMAL